MRQHYKYNPGKWGFNSRLDNLQAAILNIKLPYLRDFLIRRKQIAEMYDEGLKDEPKIKLPKLRWVYQDYIIRVKHRDQLEKFLKNNGIETLKNDYHFPDDLPKPPDTIQLESETLRLPCNPDLNDQEVKYVINQIKEWTS